MRRHRRHRCRSAAFVLGVGLLVSVVSGCDRGPGPQDLDSTTGHPAQADGTGGAVEVPTSIEAPATDPNVAPIDPTLKTVVIAPRPEHPDESARRLQELQQQNAATAEHLQADIKGHSEALTRGGDAAKVSAAMAEELGSYKQQALEVYKATGLVDEQSKAGEAP